MNMEKNDTQETAGKDQFVAYQMPPLSLLTEIPAWQKGSTTFDAESTGRLLVHALEAFGLKTELKTFFRGPTLCRFELIPAMGVNVERIKCLESTLACSIQVSSIRVQRSMPGNGTVWVEVPYSEPGLVGLREILEGANRNLSSMAIPIVLGKDMGGVDLVADLAVMPHLLIAGAAASGMTTFMNSIIAGLIMLRTPDELQLMIIDPTTIEFSAYNHTPHLVGTSHEVITDPKKATGALRWAVNEMERRYRLMAKAGVRNIKNYNARPVEKQARLICDGEEGSKLPDRLSYIVIIVNDFADLMTTEAEIEKYIARLAQYSRAVGLHIILATQRPSVDVINGNIKANFPARIALRVAQKNDSRIVLDANGAEQLLGRGDMLFLSSATSNLTRVQGAIISDDDVHRVVEFASKQYHPCPEKPRTVLPTPVFDEFMARCCKDEFYQVDEFFNPDWTITRDFHVTTVFGRDLFDTIISYRGNVGWNVYVKSLLKSQLWIMTGLPFPNECEAGEGLPVLVSIDLSNQDFRNAKLAGLDLFFPDLKGSDFSGANLSGSRIGDVEGSVFKGANLQNAVLMGDISGSDFTGALLEGTQFRDARYDKFRRPLGLPDELLAKCSPQNPSDYFVSEASKKKEAEIPLLTAQAKFRKYLWR